MFEIKYKYCIINIIVVLLYLFGCVLLQQVLFAVNSLVIFWILRTDNDDGFESNVSLVGSSKRLQRAAAGATADLCFGKYSAFSSSVILSRRCVFICCFILYLCMKRRVQYGHLCGLSPLCILR